MNDLILPLTLYLIGAFLVVTILGYLLLSKAIKLLDGHFKRLHTKLDRLLLQLQKLIDNVG